jgi:hypothetical protein
MDRGAASDRLSASLDPWGLDRHSMLFSYRTIASGALRGRLGIYLLDHIATRRALTAPGPSTWGSGGMSATRRLAAILAVDVVGYSRLMGEDEAGTARAPPHAARPASASA